VTSAQLLFIDLPETIDEGEHGENDADAGDDEKTQSEIDEAEEDRAINGVGYGDHSGREAAQRRR
jgi:hypothetical protein